MAALFGILLFICIIALIIGLIKPTLVLKWGNPETRNRGKVLLYYGLGMIVAFIGIGATAPDTSDTTSPTTVQINESRESENKSKKEDEKKATEEAKAKEKADKEALEKTKNEEKEKAEADAKAEKEAQAKAEAEAKIKEKEEAIRNPAWNVKETDAIENGNVYLVMEMLEVIKEMPLGEDASPEDVIKTPWNYYGTPLTFSGVVAAVQDFPPGSDDVRTADIVIETYDGTIVEFFSMVPSGNITLGQDVSITGYPVGRMDVDNALGGTFTHLIVVTNDLNES